MSKKRLIFCTYPSIYSSLVLKRLLADDALEVVGVVVSTRKLSRNIGALRDAWMHIRLSGWRYSAYLFMVTELFSALSMLSPFSNKLETVSRLARRYGVPVLKSIDINDLQGIDYIKECRADFLLAAHFHQLVKAQVMEIPGLNCLNIHPSLLPAYKGVDPVLYSLLDNKETIGATVHKMGQSFDTGDILAQQAFPQAQYDSLFAHNCRLFSAAADLALGLVKQGLIDGSPQLGQGAYDSWPEPSAIKKLRAGKYCLVHLRDYFRQILALKQPQIRPRKQPN